jgi:malate permease and related proteins
MTKFLFIFINVILPIFLQITAGFVFQKKFKLNIEALSKLQLYILVPSLLFTKIYLSDIGSGLFLSIMLFCTLIFIILYGVSWLLGKLLRYNRSQTSAFINSVTLYNSGNYCIPLIQLLYNNPFAFSIQIIVMVTQSILTNTVGIFNSSFGNKSMGHAFLNTLKVPMVYVVLLAVTTKALHINVWSPLLSSMEMLGQGLVPLALITLGAQLASTKFSFKLPKVYIANVMRLILSPAIAYLLTLIMGLHGVVGQVLIICSAAPTAVNSVLIALEYKNEPDYAAQAIFTSTVFSAVTVTMVIYFATRFI